MTKSIQIIITITTALVLCAGCSNDHSVRANPVVQEKIISMINKRLAPCPDTPNCVVSEGAAEAAAIEPISFSVTPEEAWTLLHRFLLESGGEIKSETNYFLHATYRSRVFRFVDDLSCRIDAESGVIQIRSASRTGYYDFGVNRRRVEKLRLFFAEQKI